MNPSSRVYYSRLASGLSILFWSAFGVFLPQLSPASVIPMNSGLPEQQNLVLRSLVVERGNILRLPVFNSGRDSAYKKSDLEAEAGRLTQYFLTGINARVEDLWVNLSLSEPDRTSGASLKGTETGKIMLEADLQLKKDFSELLSPYTTRGSNFWVRVRMKSRELFGTGQAEIPLTIRLWIEPAEIVIKEKGESAFIEKASMKVSCEPVVGQGEDSRVLLLGNYVKGLLQPLITGQLSQEVNTSGRYLSLRKVFNSLVLAQWFKQRSASSGLYNELAGRGILSGLISGSSWSGEDYFRQYRRLAQKNAVEFSSISFQSTGEVSVNSCFSGGVSFALPVLPPAGGPPLPLKTGVVTIKPADGSEIEKVYKAVVEASIKTSASSVPGLGVTFDYFPAGEDGNPGLFVYGSYSADGGLLGSKNGRTASVSKPSPPYPNSGINREEYLEGLIRSWADMLDASEGKDLSPAARNDILNIANQCVILFPFVPEQSAGNPEKLASAIYILIDLLRENIRRLDRLLKKSAEEEREEIAAEREELLTTMEYFIEYEYGLNFVVNIPKIEPYRLKGNGYHWRFIERLVRKAFLFEYGLKQSRERLLRQADVIFDLGDRLNNPYTGSKESVKEEWHKWILRQARPRNNDAICPGEKKQERKVWREYFSQKGNVQLGINKTWKTTGTFTRFISLVSVVLFLLVSLLDFGHILSNIPLFLFKLGLICLSFFISWYSVVYVGFNDNWYTKRISEIAGLRAGYGSKPDFKKRQIKAELFKVSASLTKEMNSPSADCIFVVCGEGMKKHLRLDKGFLREDVFLEVIESGSGSAAAYAQVCGALLAGEYASRLQEIARLKGKEAAEMRSIVLLFEDKSSLCAANEFLNELGVGETIFPGKPQNNLELALLNGYRATQEMKAAGRRGMAVIFADGFFAGPVKIEGDITLLGTWTDSRRVEPSGLGLIVADIGKDNRVIKLFEKAGSGRLQKKIRKSPLYSALDWENKEKTQLLGFTGISIFSFEDKTRYECFLKLMADTGTMMGGRAGLSFRYPFTREILVSLIMTVNGENPYTYLDTRCKDGEFGDRERSNDEYEFRKEMVGRIYSERERFKPSVKVCAGTDSFFLKPAKSKAVQGDAPDLSVRQGIGTLNDPKKAKLEHLLSVWSGILDNGGFDKEARSDIMNICGQCVTLTPFTRERAGGGPEALAADIYILADLLKESISGFDCSIERASGKERDDLLSDKSELLAALEYFVEYEYALNFVVNIPKIEPYRFKREDMLATKLSWLVRKLFSFEKGLRKSREQLSKQVEIVIGLGNRINGLYSGREEFLRNEWKQWMDSYSSLKRSGNGISPEPGGKETGKCRKRVQEKQPVQLGINRIWDSDRGTTTRLLSLVSLILFTLLTLAPGFISVSIPAVWAALSGFLSAPLSGAAAFLTGGGFIPVSLTFLRFCLSIIPLALSWYNLSFVSGKDSWYEENIKTIHSLQSSFQGVPEEEEMRSPVKRSISGEYDRTFDIYLQEMSAAEPSADFIVLVGSAKFGREADISPERMLVRNNGIIFKYLNDDDARSGNAWLTVNRYLLSGLEKDKQQCARLAGKKITEMRGIIIFTADFLSPLPFPVPERIKKRLGRERINNLDLAILNGYKAARRMKDQSRSGMAWMFGDSLLVSPMRIPGDITLVGTWTDYEQLSRQRPGLLIADVGMGNRLWKIYEKADLRKVRDKLEKEALYTAFDWNETARKQMLVFSGTTLFSFRDKERYAGFLALMNEVCVFAQQAENAGYEAYFVPDFLNPLLMLLNGDNPYTYLDARYIDDKGGFTMSEKEYKFRRGMTRIYETHKMALPDSMNVSVYPHGAYLKLEGSDFSKQRLALLDDSLRKYINIKLSGDNLRNKFVINADSKKTFDRLWKSDHKDEPIFKPAADRKTGILAASVAGLIAVDLIWNRSELERILSVRMERTLLKGFYYNRLRKEECYKASVPLINKHSLSGSVISLRQAVLPAAVKEYIVFYGGNSGKMPAEGRDAGLRLDRTQFEADSSGGADAGQSTQLDAGRYGNSGVVWAVTGEGGNYRFASGKPESPAFQSALSFGSDFVFNEPGRQEECVYNLWAKPKSGGDGFMLSGGLGGLSALSGGLIEKVLQALSDAGKQVSDFRFFLVNSCDSAKSMDVTPEIYAAAGDSYLADGDYLSAIEYYDLCLSLYGSARLSPVLYESILTAKQKAEKMMKGGS
ncbi:MAG: hypothetical protein WBE75_04000 [Candidatus Omnitrophota bacterium]